MKKSSFILKGRRLNFCSVNGWEFVQRSSGQNVAAVLALDANDDFILVEQYRKPAHQRVIELPAGLVGDTKAFSRERIQSCAKRELEEETGEKASSMEFLMSSPTSPGLTDEKVHIFFGKNLRHVAKGGGVGNEKIKIHRIPRKRLLPWLNEKARKGRAINLQIYAAYQMAQQKHLI
jgi:ADP-ribose pyrophosphatase